MKKSSALFLVMCLGLGLTGTAQESPSRDELLLADGLFARGFYEMALREYERLLEAYPEAGERSALLFRAAESARRQDRLSLARELYGELLTLSESADFAVRTRLRLADMAYDEGNFDVALEHAAALLELDPSPELAAAALHTLASAARHSGDLIEARDRQAQLIREYPEDPHAAYAAMMLARLEDRENLAERRRWFGVALRNPPSPDLEVEALWGLGMLELDAGEVQSAAEHFDRLWRAHPDHPRVQTGMLTIAWSQMLAERYGEALEIVEGTPARRKAELPDSWLYLEAVSLRNSGETERAYPRFRQLLDEFEDSRFRAPTAFDLALIYNEREEPRRVIALSEDLLAFPERREDVLWLLAESHRALGRTEDALRRYGELAGLRPATPRSRDAAFQKAVLLRRTDRQAAAEALTQFASDHPEDARAFSALRAAGSLWIDEGRPNSARRVLRQALDQFPEDRNRFEVEYMLARMELREGNTDEARRLFETLLSREPEGPRSSQSAYWLAVLAADRDAANTELLIRNALEREQTPEQQRHLRLRLARHLEQRRETDAAEVEYLVLLDEEGAPGLSDARLGWMLRRARSREDQEALLRISERMTEAHRGEPTREAGYYARAEVAFARGNTEKAVEAWQTGLAFEAEHRQAAEAAYALGRALMETGELDPVEGLFQKAMRWGGRSEDAALQARAMMGLGDLFARRGGWNEAARMYMGLAVLFDDAELSPAALRRAAGAFQRAGRPDEARKVLQELEDRFPDVTEAP